MRKVGSAAARRSSFRPGFPGNPASAPPLRGGGGTAPRSRPSVLEVAPRRDFSLNGNAQVGLPCSGQRRRRRVQGGALRARHRLDPARLADALDEVVLVDVRRDVERSDGGIAGAVELPLERLRDDGRSGARRVLLFCDQGRRGYLAARIARQRGVVRTFRDNPVMDVGGKEVTYWDFDRSALERRNLFADDTVGTS